MLKRWSDSFFGGKRNLCTESERMFQPKEYSDIKFGCIQPIDEFDLKEEGLPEKTVSFVERVYEDEDNLLMQADIKGILSGSGDGEEVLREGTPILSLKKEGEIGRCLSEKSLLFIESHAEHQLVLSEIADLIQYYLHIKRVGEQMYYYKEIIWRKLTDGENLRAVTNDFLEVHDMLNKGQFAEIYNILKGRIEKYEELEVGSVELQDKVNFRNGVYDVRKNIMLKHSPEFAFVSFIPFDFQVGEHGTGCVFDQYLESLSLGNYAIRQRVLQWIGYCISNLPNMKKIALFLGERDSGKTTLALIIACIVGKENVQSFSFDGITRFSNDTMFGKKIGLCTDLKGSKLSSESIEWLKNQTGGDFVYADVKHSRHTYSYISSCKYIIASNFRPNLEEDEALENRFLVIPFPKSVPENQKNFNLIHDIGKELQHVFYLAFEALRDFLDSGMQFADIGDWEYYTPTYYTNQANCIADFFREKCCLDETGKVSRAEMYDSYCDYVKKKGINEMVSAKFFREFKKIAKENRIKDDTNDGRKYKGVVLKKKS